MNLRDVGWEDRECRDPVLTRGKTVKLNIKDLIIYLP